MELINNGLASYIFRFRLCCVSVYLFCAILVSVNLSNRSNETSIFHFIQFLQQN